MNKKNQRTENPQAVECAIPRESNSSNTIDELAGFFEYASGLRSLWHWIELLTENPNRQTYFHKMLMEEIEVGNGCIYCPGTKPLGGAPAFPNATTPSERALAIAITQGHFYLVGFGQCAVDNVDRLSLTLHYCHEYKHKIRLADAVAKSLWSCLPEGVWTLPILELARKFLESWRAVVNLLVELLFVVDTEIHTTRFSKESAPKRGAFNLDRTPPKGFSDYMPKSDIERFLKKGIRQLKRDSDTGKGPKIIEAHWNTQWACYSLEIDTKS